MHVTSTHTCAQVKYIGIHIRMHARTPARLHTDACRCIERGAQVQQKAKPACKCPLACQVVFHRAALPRGHPARINSRLSAAVAFALDGQLDEAVTIINM